MTLSEKAAWFIRHPAALGRQLGFSRLRDDLHGRWIAWMVSGTEDGTLQAHRGSYKTTCLEVALPLLMIKNPAANIIFMRKTDADVGEVMTAVDRILRHPLFRQIFETLTGAELQVLKSTSTEITTSAYNAPKGSAQLMGVGIGGSLTGKHADLIITDDIVNLKDRVSRAERERTRAIYQELQNIRNPGGRIFNTGTPWHRDDAFALMPPPLRFDWRKTGMLPPEKITALRQSMAPSLFAANYELRHIAVENALFVTERPFTEDKECLRDGKAHVDAAYGGEDYTAFTAGRRKGGKLYLYGRLWQRHVSECLPAILQEADRLLCGKIFCEDNADKGYLQREIRARGGRAVVYHESMNKHLKISTFLKKEWENIVFLEGTDPEYIQQIMDYTEDAEHDDAPDSAACICRLCAKESTAYTSVFG